MFTLLREHEKSSLAVARAVERQGGRRHQVDELVIDHQGCGRHARSGARRERQVFPARGPGVVTLIFLLGITNLGSRPPINPHASARTCS